MSVNRVRRRLTRQFLLPFGLLIFYIASDDDSCTPCATNILFVTSASRCFEDNIDLPQVRISLWFMEQAVTIVMPSAPCVDLPGLGDCCKDWASLAPAAKTRLVGFVANL